MSCTYLAIYENRRAEIEARDLWDAKQKADEIFNPPKSRRGLVGVYLLKDSNGDPVQVIPQTF